MKKGILLFLVSILSLLLFLSPVVAEKRIYDEWVSHNDTIVLEGFTYKVVATEDLLIVENLNNSGKMVLVYNITYDQDGLNWMNKGMKYKGYDEDANISGIRSDDPYIYEYNLYVTKPTNALKVSRSFAQKKNYVYDDYDFIISVKNTGDEDLKYLTYTEKIPDFLEFKEAREDGTGRVLQITDSNNENIRWKFNVKEGETLKIIIDYEFKNYDNDREYYLNPARIDYKIQDRDMLYELKSSKITFHEPLYVTFGSFPKRVDYGNSINSKIKFENIHEDESIYLNDLYFRVPDGLQVVDYDNFLFDEVTSDYLYIDSVTIDQDGYEEFPIEFESFISGTAEFVLDYEYTFRGEKIVGKSVKEFITQFDEPSIDLQIMASDGESLRSGKLGFAQYSFLNNQDVELDNVTIELDSDFFDKKVITLEKVAAKKISKDVISGRRYVSSGSVSDNVSFQFPFVDSKENRVVSLFAKIMTKDGNERVLEKNITIEVYPAIKKNHFSYSGKIESYENNEYYVRLYIHKTSDEVPKSINFTIEGNGYSKNISFSDREAYNFRSEGQKRKYYLTIPIPYDKNESQYDLKIKAESDIDGYYLEQEDHFILDPNVLIFSEKEEAVVFNVTKEENVTEVDDTVFEKESHSALDAMSVFFGNIFKATLFKYFVGAFLIVLLGVILFSLYSKAESGNSGFSMKGGSSNSVSEMDGLTASGKNMTKNDFKSAEMLYDQESASGESTEVFDVGFERKRKD